MLLATRTSVRVHHPLQQGLRRETHCDVVTLRSGASASSITTRIKTMFCTGRRYADRVRVHHPLQQGLRLGRS